ncbi:MAG: CRISPR-associated endonuclease Cas2 [Caldilineaceae bacterium]
MADTRTTTLYVVAYDIPSDRRRTKIPKVLSGFGHWTQFSLFECFLTEKQYLQLRRHLENHLKPDEDSVRFYVICAGCQSRSETLGGALPSEPDIFLV